MLTIIIYDIKETNNRNKIIKKLQHYGLKRIQKSAFMGDIKLSYKKELTLALQENIQANKDSIIIIPVCNTCQEKIITHGTPLKYTEDEYVIE